VTTPRAHYFYDLRGRITDLKLFCLTPRGVAASPAVRTSLVTLVAMASVAAALSLAGCASRQKLSTQTTTLSAARTGFKTTLSPPSAQDMAQREPVEPAPPAVFKTITYPAPTGALAAYLTPNPGDGKRHPAIIWITGGDCNTIGDVWSPKSRDNDQTATAYRKAGIVVMFPSLRGGNTNPGTKEGFLGEVDDILAAAEFLGKQPYVDPARIYLGGHSTGGTLALLVSECSPRFRDVFAFGPVEDVSRYGTDSGFLPFNLTNDNEVKLRSPGYWLASIKSPTWVLEGTGGNIDSLRAMARVSANPEAHFVEIQGADHFDTLAPTNELIATKILQDTGAASNIALTSDEVSQNFAR